MLKQSTTTAVAVQAFLINDTPVRQDKDGRVSLTDIYQIAELKGWTEGKADPRDWQRYSGKELIDVVAETLNVGTSHIIKATRGKGGGTYAHKNIALAYAKYLSPHAGQRCLPSCGIW